MAATGSATVGWIFRHYDASGVKFRFRPPVGVNISHDQSRQIRRTISGLTLIPQERLAPGLSQRNAIDLSQDQVEVIMTLRDDQSGVTTEHRMGIFNFTGATIACDAVRDGALGSTAASDLYHVALSDNTVKLLRSDEIPMSAPGGTDPTGLMIKLLEEDSLLHAIAGSAGSLTETFWAPFTTHSDIIAQLGVVAGHRSFWADNDGVIRSVSALVADTETIDLLDLVPVAGSISINENYLTAPNRVVIQDDTALYPTIGTWDAPAISPTSAARRGWTLTHGVNQQAIGGAVHANAIAQTIGESFSAATLTADVLPTYILDGPRVLEYRGRLWLLDSWSLNTDVGAKMSLQATELIGVKG